MKNMIFAELKTSLDEKRSIDRIPFNIGSFGDICQYCYEDPDVAPIHCQIIFEGNRFRIRDRNSRIGLEINGKQVEPRGIETLNHGDEIKIAELRLYFLMPQEVFSEEESKNLNHTFQKMNGELEEKKRSKLGEETIQKLLDKIVFVNQVCTGDKKLKKEQALEYLKNLTEDLNISPKVVIQRSEKRPPIEKRNTQPIKKNPSMTSPQGLESRILQEEVVVKKPQSIQKEMPKITNRALPVESEHPSPGIKVNSEPINNRIIDGFDVPIPKSFNQNNKVCFLEPINLPIDAICIKKTPFKIGKTSEFSDYVLDQRGISRNHAEIISEIGNRGFLIRDMGSTNGTFVNGVQLQNRELPLMVGDTVSFYKYEFKVTKA